MKVIKCKKCGKESEVKDNVVEGFLVYDCTGCGYSGLIFKHNPNVYESR